MRSGRFSGTLCLTDVLALVYITWGVSAGSDGLGIRENVAFVFFTTVWTTAAITRLMEFRSGRRPALKLGRIHPRTTAIVLAGTVPWMVLGCLQSIYATSAIWVPFEVPPLLRALGVPLAIVAVAEPFVRSILKRSPGSEAAAEYRLSIAVLVRSAAILLLSGSPVFTLFCGLWLTVALWPARGCFRFRFRSISAETLASQHAFSTR
jgi:hypothetical protein